MCNIFVVNVLEYGVRIMVLFKTNAISLFELEWLFVM